MTDVKKDLTVELRPNGIDAWDVIMSRTWKNNFFTVEQCRIDLKALRLKSFPGENVKALMTAAEPHMTRLERCGEIGSTDSELDLEQGRRSFDRQHQCPSRTPKHFSEF